MWVPTVWLFLVCWCPNMEGKGHTCLRVASRSGSEVVGQVTLAWLDQFGHELQCLFSYMLQPVFS